MSWDESTLVRALNRRPRPSTVRPPGVYVGTAEELIGGDGRRPMCLPIEPTQHTFVSGRTGSGKTTLELDKALEYYLAGIPFLFLAVHGETIDDLLGLLATKKAKDPKPLLFEPGSDARTGPVPGCNFLETRGETPHGQVQELVGIFSHFWADSWGPRMHELTYMTLLALAAAGLTILEATPFLSLPEFRRAVLRHVNIPEVREFFELRVARWSASQLSTAIEPVLNKLSAFHDPALKYVVGQENGTIDLDRALADGQTIIFSSAHLSGNNYLFAALFLAVFRARVFRRPSDAKQYAVIVDEFQEVIGW